MNEKLIRNVQLVLLAAAMMLGLYALVSFLEVNKIRADEFLSFLHSDPAFHSHPVEVWKNIGEGADNSYIHATALQVWFRAFGATIVSQRLLSFLFWVVGGIFLWIVLNEQQKTRAHKLFFWALVQFGSMGFLLATDGRFYSMHYAAMLALFLLLLRYTRSGNDKWLFAISFTTFISMLITALSAVGLVLSLLALSLLCMRKLISIQRFARLAIAFIVPVLVYFTAFRIEGFHQHFSTWLFSKPTADALPLNEFISTPFRFFVMVDIPGFPDEVGVGLTCCLAGAWVYFSRKTLAAGQPLVFTLVNELFLLLVVFLVLQLAAYFVFSWPLWPYRYYAGISWIVPIWLCQYTTTVFSKQTASVVLILAIGVCLRMLDETGKIAERKLQIPAPVTQQTIFTEEFENYKTLAKMGEQYIRYPQTRSYLFLKLDSNSTERNTYFRLLQQQGDDLKTIELTETGIQ